jgi:hypothetical protein
MGAKSIRRGGSPVVSTRHLAAVLTRAELGREGGKAPVPGPSPPPGHDGGEGPGGERGLPRHELRVLLGGEVTRALTLLVYGSSR